MCYPTWLNFSVADGYSRKRTVHMWKLYATVYPSQLRDISPYRCIRIEGPSMPMREYLDSMKSDTLSWGVALTLFTAFASMPELVDIASVKNLVALELNASSEIETLLNDKTTMPMAALNDRVVRTWSELAESGTAFAHLQVLRLSYQEHVSKATLQYLKSFPSLRLLVVYNCPSLSSLFESDNQKIAGWQPVVDHSTHLEAAYTSDEIYGYYNFIKESDEKGPSMYRNTPILGFQIGREIRRPSKSRNTPDTVYLKRQNRHQEQEDTTDPPAKRPRQASGPRAARRGTMKARKAKDLDGVLGDLIGL